MTPLDYALHYKHSEVTLAMVMHPSRSVEYVDDLFSRPNPCLHQWRRNPLYGNEKLRISD